MVEEIGVVCGQLNDTLLAISQSDGVKIMALQVLENIRHELIPLLDLLLENKNTIFGILVVYDIFPMLSPDEKAFRLLLRLVNIVRLFVKCHTIRSDLLVLLLYFVDVLFVYTIANVVLNLFIL